MVARQRPISKEYLPHYTILLLLANYCMIKESTTHKETEHKKSRRMQTEKSQYTLKPCRLSSTSLQTLNLVLL